MDPRAEFREFLTSRRARITPAQAGLPDRGGARRVPGLRREEVALLAGVSVDYYTRLERGNAAGASESVLEALARALQLDSAERAHLFDLARAARAVPGTAVRRPQRQAIRPSMQQLLDALQGTPAFIRNGRLDILAVNPLGLAMHADLWAADPAATANLARFLFLDPRAPGFFAEFDKAADQTAALLRIEAGRDPFGPELTELVGQLSTRSEVFRVCWAKHDVRFHDHGVKHFRHPEVGELELTWESLDLTDSGLTLVAYTAAPGSPTAERLALLESWIATPGVEVPGAATMLPGG